MKYIPEQLARNLSRQILVARKHSPRVLFVAGIAGVVTSTVLACKATLKLEAELDEMQTQINNVKELKTEHPDIQNNYPAKQYRRDMLYVYSRGTYRIARLYAPAIVVGGASIGALTGAHVTLTRRNASLTAAYAAMSRSFDEYRERVKKELGAEKEEEIRYPDPPDGVMDKDGQPIDAIDPSKWSPYARIFDEYNPNWKKNAALNKLFLQAQQNYANDLLKARGHIFLNEVYDMLGFERTRPGAAVGWLLDSEDGDHFVDFGLFIGRNARFINGDERSVILDFNVDGVMWDKI